MPVKLHRRDKIIFIVGPTAAGKSALAVKLTRRINGEVISCDSMQVYRGMRILSQAPKRPDMGGIRHHLTAIVDPREEFSVARYIKKARAAIKAVVKRGKCPIVVGGTGLYAKALVDGLFPSPKADMSFRCRMQDFAKRYGRDRLYEKLVRLDSEASASIHPNDTRRTIRALEVIYSTGRTMTEMKSETRGIKDSYEIKLFGITMPRDRLCRAIDSRVDRMFDDGLVREVRRLSKRRLSRTAASAIGLSEVLEFLAGRRSLEETKELMKTNTRRFAKRQLCWFRADKRIKWFDMSRMKEREVIRKIEKWNEWGEK